MDLKEKKETYESLISMYKLFEIYTSHINRIDNSENATRLLNKKKISHAEWDKIQDENNPYYAYRVDGDSQNFEIIDFIKTDIDDAFCKLFDLFSCEICCNLKEKSSRHHLHYKKNKNGTTDFFQICSECHKGECDQTNDYCEYLRFEDQ